MKLSFLRFFALINRARVVTVIVDAFNDRIFSGVEFCLFKYVTSRTVRHSVSQLVG